MFLIWFGLWFRYGFGMFWMWFWYGFDMVWERSAFFRVPDGLASRKETETALGQPFGRFLDGFVVLIWFLIRFWYDFDMMLIQFWYASSELVSEKGTETAQGQVFGRFFRRFLWVWYDFNTILTRFWYDFDMVLIRFWIWFRWVGFKSQVWLTSRITTETISKSYLKPYQHHNYKTAPETIHNNKSYLKRIKIL